MHFCCQQGIHPDPEFRIGEVVLPVVPETKFLGLIFNRKLTFIPHIKQLRVKCTRAVNILRVLFSTTWGADQRSVLKIYRALIQSKHDYESLVYGSVRPLALKMLDPIHHQGLWLCTGAFRTSPVKSLCIESHEPSLHLHYLQLSLLSALKLRSLLKCSTWGCVFFPQWAMLFQKRWYAIAPFGLRTKAQFDELGLSSITLLYPLVSPSHHDFLQSSIVTYL
ncbi:uncharacterized protein LOC143222198 isoform X1 [Tachypleus tridentatus]|uniref:uncharacterized protein LOC143222198 isoform X1 n=1 Tax=Tachypleus tridentatus TaxID=6853 RepID=UPI003FD227A0